QKPETIVHYEEALIPEPVVSGNETTIRLLDIDQQQRVGDSRVFPYSMIKVIEGTWVYGNPAVGIETTTRNAIAYNFGEQGVLDPVSRDWPDHDHFGAFGYVPDVPEHFSDFDECYE